MIPENQKGGSPLWTLIETQIVSGSSTQSMSFTVPAGVDLMVRFRLLGTITGAPTAAVGLVLMRPNGVNQGTEFTYYRHLTSDTGGNAITGAPLRTTVGVGAMFADLTEGVQLTGTAVLEHAVGGERWFEVNQKIWPEFAASATTVQHATIENRWRNTTEVMTSMEFFAEDGAYIDIGSSISVYRLSA